MRRDDAYKGALMDTLVELRTQPFRNPVLQTHDVGKAKNGKKIYSSDVGGRAADRRLVWQLFNKTIVVLLYGTHAVQDRAKRMAITFDPTEHVVTVVEEAPDTGVDRDYREQRVACRPAVHAVDRRRARLSRLPGARRQGAAHGSTTTTSSWSSRKRSATNCSSVRSTC